MLSEGISGYCRSLTAFTLSASKIIASSEEKIAEKVLLPTPLDPARAFKKPLKPYSRRAFLRF
jgi:hypothetical protein